MKYLILIGDGMGDRPMAEHGGKTVLELAATPHMDRLAREGELGLAQTIPPSCEPGSDTANMSLLGFDPARYHTGRAPIEAAAMGIELGAGQAAFRCNLVNLVLDGDQVVMGDYCSGHIDTESATRLVNDLQARLGRPGVVFRPGVSFRHVLTWQDAPLKAPTVPPHDRSGQGVADVLARPGHEAISELVRGSWSVLENHPVNKERVEKGLTPANSIWLWGQGTRPAFPTIPESYGLSGVVVSAVDLIKGLGRLCGREVWDVPGATGWLDSNFAGKVAATLTGLARHDFAFLHVEAPDEAGHSGKLANKLQAIELFDREVVGPVLAGMAGMGPHRVLLACDHHTPLSIKTHSREPIPYVIWDSRHGVRAGRPTASGRPSGPAGAGILGSELIGRLLER